MKRALIIGLGCILMAGCGPVTASDAEQGSPLLAPEDDADPAGPIQGTTPCPVCKGAWNGESGSLWYLIPTDVLNPELDVPISLTFYLVGEKPKSCTFWGSAGETTVFVDCPIKSKIDSIELTFTSSNTLMSAPVDLDPPSNGPMADPPIIDVQ